MIQVNIFLDEIYNFLRTVSIKNDYIVDHIRQQEIIRLDVDSIEDIDNPYYINLMGDYSPIDTEMYIMSLDFPDTQILFSKANLAVSPKTRFAYQIPGTWYDNLVSRFPLQRDLIKNILYPVTLEYLTEAESYTINDIVNSTGATVIEATYLARRNKTINKIAAMPNFSLLQYDISQIEPQETSSLIEILKNQLEMFRIRWDVKEFKYEDFFPMSLWVVLWATLPNVLFSQRIKNLRTTAVHSTHIWEYLTSKGLGDYRSILTSKQQMFLYKNIDYIIKTRGKDGTLSILADELLKSHRVTLKAKAIILNTENMVENGAPVAEIISSDIRDNTSPSQDAANGYETVATIVKRQYDRGLEPILTDSIIADQEDRLSHMKDTWLPTKLVELNRTDLYTSEHNHFVKFIFESILYRQYLGSLNYTIVVRPKDTEIDLSLTTGEVIALIAYCADREFTQKSLMTTAGIEEYIGLEIIDSSGNIVTVTEGNKASFVGTEIEFRTLTEIPSSARLVTPFKDDLSDELDSVFHYGGRKYDIAKVMDIEGKVNRISSLAGSIESPKDLLRLLDGQYSVLNKDVEGLRSTSNATYHIAFDKLYSQLLINGIFDLNLDIPYTTYSEWFEANIQIGSVIELFDANVNSKVAYSELSNDLLLALIPLEDATSTVFSNFTSSDFALMRQLFIQLCSYNITFLDTDRAMSSYLRFTPIVVRDQLEREYATESRYQIPNLSEREERSVEDTFVLETNVAIQNRSIREVVHSVQGYTLVSPKLQETTERAVVAPFFQRQVVSDRVITGNIPLPWDGFAPQNTVADIVNNITYVNSVVPNYIKTGLVYKFYELPILTNTLPNFNALTPTIVDIATEIVLMLPARDHDFGVTYEGYLDIPHTNDWTLTLNSVDGSNLYIDDTLLINKNGVIGPTEKSVGMALKKGLHKFRLEFFVRTATPILSLAWSAPSTPYSGEIPASAFYHI